MIYCKASKENIIQKLANATKTYYNCGGHHKADMNKQNMIEYKKILRDHGETIPVNDNLLDIGIFNGEGSY